MELHECFYLIWIVFYLLLQQGGKVVNEEWDTMVCLAISAK